jgi:hypothetical protein
MDCSSLRKSSDKVGGFVGGWDGNMPWDSLLMRQRQAKFEWIKKPG